jgi:hypothetical protein
MSGMGLAVIVGSRTTMGLRACLDKSGSPLAASDVDEGPPERIAGVVVKEIVELGVEVLFMC